MVGPCASVWAEEIVRVVFDYQIFARQAYGGISRYFVRIAQGLLGMRHQVRVFAPLHQNRYLSELPEQAVSGRYIRGHHPKARRLVLAYNQYFSGPAIARSKPDLVHETYFSKRGFAPKGCPTVVTVHDMIHELFPEAFSARDDTASNKRAAVEHADHVICVSNNTKSDLMRLYGTPFEKVSVVQHGFDQFAPAEESNQPPTSGGRPYLLYVGERSRSYKNFAGFLKAVATSRRLPVDFDVIAFGEPSFAAGELKVISSLGFGEGQVRQMSGSDDLLGEVYESARALVYPSLYEGFGIPPLEAMAHQCPVISSNASSMPEVIGGAGEYFNPKNTDEMRQAIESVVYSDSRIGALRIAGLERLKTFSWEKCTRETLNIYQSLVRQPLQ